MGTSTLDVEIQMDYKWDAKQVAWTSQAQAAPGMLLSHSKSLQDHLQKRQHSPVRLELLCIPLLAVFMVALAHVLSFACRLVWVLRALWLSGGVCALILLLRQALIYAAAG